MNRLLTLICIVILASSCRSTRKIGVAINNRKDSSQVASASGRADSLAFIHGALQQLGGHHITYKTFSAKVNIDYKDATNKNYNVNATIRMQKDSAIWISANALLGIEAIRAYITRDSVKILDKLNKVYTARSMRFLQEQTDMPLTLSIMEDLIVGNPVFLDTVGSYTRNPSSGTVTMLSVGTLFKHLLTLNESNMTLAHSKIDDVDPAQSRTADITYDDYAASNGVLFSTKRQLLLSEVKKLNIKLDFRAYDFGVPVSFPFGIPKNYKRN
ncbi:DUF4292 domain-containing protein [Flaviaesturariibacter flavus]|uniref:DUF4292 domain-containing protein n=1 Tax=Flaviaesturariibacter flavus TaxID=2502780 RepID=A0A4R1B8G1_9BACT|nr:DUF4292 domain-containing protein [Flaviaesturariibacter flavus]TCJ13308.1 DUF4292 domain-containing protein [Flaviaesturariibacter flavus]